jgi:flagellar operon protein
MAESIHGVSVPFLPIGESSSPKVRNESTRTDGKSFDALLQDSLRELKFSKHAKERLESRNITLNQSDLDNLEKAVSKIEQKGGRESLVLMNNLAFIINVQDRTVVTAIDPRQSSDNVFTNIDSAVVSL